MVLADIAEKKNQRKSAKKISDICEKKKLEKSSFARKWWFSQMFAD
jgi:hypothetical protein